MSEGVNSKLKFSTTLKSAQIQNEWDSDTNKNMEMWNFFLPVLSEINSIWVQVLEPEASQSHASGSNKVPRLQLSTPTRLRNTADWYRSTNYNKSNTNATKCYFKKKLNSNSLL